MQDYIVPENVFQVKRKKEMLDGRIYNMASPSPNHNRVAGNIYLKFRNFLKGKRCRVFMDGVDVKFNDKNVVIPDVMIVCNKDIIKKDGIYGAPDLIVEVLSPSTAERDIGYKKELYAQHGVSEYWIVNPADKTVQVYLLRDNLYRLDKIYQIYEDWFIEKKMEPEEVAAIIMEFRPSLPGFEDLLINVEEIFENVD